MIFQASLLVCFFAAVVQCQLFCQGGPGEGASPGLVEASFKQLIQSIPGNQSFTRQSSFTGGFRDADVYVVTRIMKWSSDSSGDCFPQDLSLNVSGQDLKEDYNNSFEHWSRGQFDGHSWGMLQRYGTILDYFTVKNLQPLNFTISNGLPSSYCSVENNTFDDPRLSVCDPRTKTLVSGNNGVFNVLRSGESISSRRNTLCFLKMQEDCDLVLYKNYTVLDRDLTNSSIDRGIVRTWSSGTEGKGRSCYLLLQPDLNLAIFNGSNNAKLWSTNLSMQQNSAPTATGVLTVEVDTACKLVLYATVETLTPIWELEGTLSSGGTSIASSKIPVYLWLCLCLCWLIA